MRTAGPMTVTSSTSPGQAEPDQPAASGKRDGNCVKVVQRLPVKVLFENGQDNEHTLRPGMSVVPSVKIK